MGAVLNAARVRPGESVLVMGLGGAGLCAVQGARLAGAGLVVAVDPAPSKAPLARRFGATEVLEPSTTLAKRVRALTESRGMDHAIECVGRGSTIRSAWSCTRRGGHTTVVGLGSITGTLGLVTDRIGLADVGAAFDRMRAGQGARSLIVF